jgi:hypothetical protein
MVRDGAHISGRQSVLLSDKFCVFADRLSRQIDSQVFADELRDRSMGFERSVGLRLGSPNPLD